MKNEKLQQLYEKLSLLSVFIGVWEKPLFGTFENYCRASGAEKKRAYARFVAEIYEGGGSLTELVQTQVFENENAYIKAAASGEKCPDCIVESAKKELELLSKFASLTRSDFALDMGISEQDLPDFESVNATLPAAYQKRLQNVRKVGYGIFSTHGMFRLSEERTIEPILSADKTQIEKFIGYEAERGKVMETARAFVAGKSAANVLLYGDAGTGKSSTVKAVANAFYGDGVRLIELRKDQLSLLPFVMGKIAGNPLKFIIFIDDLSFNRSDDHFSMLKAALEGSASAKAENAVIYATSNRRHIIKENFSDRDGDDVHVNDTLQETLSLSERFSLTVLFAKPDKKLYLEIVERLSERFSLAMPKAELFERAEAFALRKGNRSARCAEQFIESLL